ncbi:MAG: heavy metal sensor histidine kinase [Betaproteobacteria bacterium]|nr:heavy metal sensor histidine kinase [Betaproteobacteria bacterium]MBI2959727.1 heavy metal sensor histidine kinase [Betaproteobacteria bacterium]
MKRSARPSITARLSFAFGAVSVLISGGVGVYLYGAIDEELMQRHRDELTTKVVLIRDALSRVASVAGIAAAIQRSPNTSSAPERMHLSLIGADSELLFASDTLQVPAYLFGKSASAGDMPSDFRLWVSPAGNRYLVTSAFARLGKLSKQQPLITVALDVREEHNQSLSRFRARLSFALAAQVILAVLLGSLLAHRGLRPVRRFAAYAALVTSKHLDKRLDESTVPAELAQLVLAFNSMLARLQESFRQLEDFSSDLAHELRTPINSLMGQAEVALSGVRTTEEYRRLLQANLEEYSRLSRMIADMLFLAHAAEQHLSLKREAVDVRAEIQKVLEFYDALLEDRGLRASLSGEATVSADRSLLQRAVTNLLSNAIRYAPRGEVIGIAISREDGGGVSIEVSNAGPGIAAEHLPRIFDRFYRIDGGRTREHTGLGLAIVRSIMRLHGGEVTVASVPGDLTRFRLVFP